MSDDAMATSPSKAELLRAVPLFAEVDDDDIEELAAAAKARSFAQGAPIFHIGEPGRSLFVVTSGSVQIHHPERDAHFELAQFGPGDFFGEMALLNDAPRSASAHASSDVDALVVDKVDFRRIITEKPNVAIKVLQALSRRVRSADELIQGLTSQSLQDSLTGLLNRKAFQIRMNGEVARARRYGGVFALIILDLDDFGRVNDELGRAAGDRILSWVGRLLIEHTRSSDQPFRFGDDRFTLICPGITTEAAEAVAARLSALLNEAKAPIEHDLSLTVSTSLASCPVDGEEAVGLYRVAEQRLEKRG